MTILRSGHITVEPYHIDKWSMLQMVDWLNDKELMKYSGQRHKEHTFTSQYEYLSAFKPPHLFRIIKLDRAIIGTLTAHFDEHNGIANVGILLGEKRGYGYGVQSWWLFCNYLFEHGVRKVEAGMCSANRPMRAICEKTGMEFDGRRLDHFIVDGKPCDVIYYARFK